jgi:hypothetical protein
MMDIFVEFILERYQRINPTIQIVGSPILPNELEVDQSYLYFDVYTDRESSDSIPVQILYDPERRVKKVIYKSYHNSHPYNKYYLFLGTSNDKIQIPEDGFVKHEDREIYTRIYKYTEDYACK